MKFKIEIDPQRIYDSMESAKNFLNSNPSLINSLPNPRISIVIEQGN